MIGSSVSLPTSRTSFSVISAKASAALRCRSTLSLNESVERDLKGSPVKKSVSALSVGGDRPADLCQAQSLSGIGFASLQLTFEVLQKVGYGIALIVEQQRLILSIAGATAFE